jgi:hypothetical protein
MGRVGELVEERGIRDAVRRPESGQVAREGVRVTGEVEYTLRLPCRLEHLRLDHALARRVEQHGGWTCVRRGGGRGRGVTVYGCVRVCGCAAVYGCERV